MQSAGVVSDRRLADSELNPEAWMSTRAKRKPKAMPQKSKFVTLWRGLPMSSKETRGKDSKAGFVLMTPPEHELENNPLKSKRTAQKELCKQA